MLFCLGWSRKDGKIGRGKDWTDARMREAEEEKQI